MRDKDSAKHTEEPNVKATLEAAEAILALLGSAR